MESSPAPQKIPSTLFGQNEFSPDSRVVDIQSGLTHFIAQTSKILVDTTIPLIFSLPFSLDSIICFSLGFLIDQGEVFAWGRNKTACLGMSNDLDQFFPMKVNIHNKNYLKNTVRGRMTRFAR